MFRLRSHLSDGFVVDLDGEHPSIEHASMAADEYMTHYSDPCGLGITVDHVDIIDTELEANG